MLVGLAPSHPILANKKKVVSVSFPDGENGRRDLTGMQISGKKKHGSADMDIHSVLCTVTCEDGSSHILYACVRGKLYELNMRLKEQPSLLNDYPEAEGFIAITMCQSQRLDKELSTLMKADAYYASIGQENPLKRASEGPDSHAKRQMLEEEN